MWCGTIREEETLLASAALPTPTSAGSYDILSTPHEKTNAKSDYKVFYITTPHTIISFSLSIYICMYARILNRSKFRYRKKRITSLGKPWQFFSFLRETRETAPTCFATTRVWNYCVFVQAAIVTPWLFDRCVAYNSILVDDTIDRPELGYAFCFSFPSSLRYVYIQRVVDMECISLQQPIVEAYRAMAWWRWVNVVTSAVAVVMLLLLLPSLKKTAGK